MAPAAVPQPTGCRSGFQDHWEGGEAGRRLGQQGVAQEASQRTQGAPRQVRHPCLWGWLQQEGATSPGFPGKPARASVSLSWGCPYGAPHTRWLEQQASSTPSSGQIRVATGLCSFPGLQGTVCSS